MLGSYESSLEKIAPLSVIVNRVTVAEEEMTDGISFVVHSVILSASDYAFCMVPI